MTLIFQSDELNQLLQAQAQSTPLELLADEQERTLFFPDWLGTGYKRDILLQRDLSLTLHRYQLNEDFITLGSEVTRNCFEFSFVATGKAQIEQQLFMAEQKVFLINSELPACEIREYAGCDRFAVDVHISKSALAAMVMDYEGMLPLALQRMAIGNDDRPALAPLHITPAMQQALQQIWCCPYQGLTRSLYLEAKSLELIALYIQALQTEPVPQPSLRTGDLDSIHEAREILHQNLQSPPSLVELARQVGINDRKLKQGFREVLGTTVFGYLTQQRMEMACQLLRQDRSIAAVAASVGYESPTSFSGAFRRRFGMTPKAYQRSGDRRA